MSKKYRLPSKIISYLKRLDVGYARSGNEILSKIVRNAHIHIEEETNCKNNFAEDYYGHDVFLFLDLTTIAEIEPEDQNHYCSKINRDLNSIKSIEDEFVNNVYFDPKDENDSQCQKSMPIKSHVQIDPDNLSFWKPDHIRLFISHRDDYKGQANNLAKELEKYGISAFVAHDTIEPMTTWQEEIMKGLQTMEIMLAFITDNFSKSSWTNQEIGVALGRNIPIISLKLENESPCGFIQTKQALKGNLRNLAKSVPEIYNLTIELIGGERCKSVLISKFLTSRNYGQALSLCKLMDETINSLSDDEAEQIIYGFSNNSQLYGSVYLKDPLCDFLKRTTGKDYFIRRNKICAVEDCANDDVPF